MMAMALVMAAPLFTNRDPSRKTLKLSPTEFRLLRYLMLNPGRVLTRAQLLDHVWEYDFRGSSTVVSTYVAYLRRKLARYGPDLIHTQRAVGYSLRLPRG
jgi:two-component system, OmpR family, response regulator